MWLVSIRQKWIVEIFQFYIANFYTFNLRNYFLAMWLAENPIYLKLTLTIHIGFNDNGADAMTIDTRWNKNVAIFKNAAIVFLLEFPFLVIFVQMKAQIFTLSSNIIAAKGKLLYFNTRVCCTDTVFSGKEEEEEKN